MSTPQERHPSLVKVCVIPQRYVIAIMGTMGVMFTYITRVSLNIAITQMVPPKNHTVSNDSCPVDEDFYESSVKDRDYLYHWEEWIQGIILGAFYWGYIASHVPGGMLSDKYGGRHVFGGGSLVSVVTTLLTPIVITSSNGNWIALSALRIIQGLGQGVVFPALTSLLAKWVPKKERSSIGTFVFGGNLLGTIISNMINGQLMAHSQTWTVVFYLWGSIALLWNCIWYILCFSTPEYCPYIKDKELDYLEEAIGKRSGNKLKVPWKAILSSAPVWALILAQIGHVWCFFTIVTTLPKYMNDVLRFNIKSNGMWNSTPYALMWVVSIISGILCDWLINHNKISITFARKFFTIFAAVVPGAFIMAASYSGCNKIVAALMFTLAMGSMGPFFCGLKVNALDLSPNYSGILMALNNGCGAMMGVLAPLLVGMITTNHTLAEWQIVFWINFAILAVTALIYAIWASGKVQWWNDMENKPGPDNAPST